MNSKLISICLAMVTAIATVQAAEMLVIVKANETAQTNPKHRQYDGSSNYGNAEEASSSQSANYNAQASSSNNNNNNNQGSGSSSGYNNNGGGSSSNYVRQNSTACNEQQGSPIIAKCTMTAPKNSTVNGTLMMTQADAESPVMLTGTLSGVMPAGNHGVHVHESGDFSDGCTSAGEHYNPDNTTHGAPTDPEYKRHIGDLGNAVADASGNVVFNLNMGDGFSLFGWKSVIGRSLVIHRDMDDLGRGNNNDSLTTGHSDGRLGCCVIAYARRAS